MAAPLVEVVGLRALMKDLKAAGDDRSSSLIKEMQQAGKVAMQPIADAARGTVPHDTGRVHAEAKGPTLEQDIRVTASRTGAAVRMGRKGKLEYAGWIEFGGVRHRPHTSERAFVKDGRFLFPAARGLTQTAKRLYEDGVARAFDHYHWTNTSADPESAHD
jgi:hypothetical protein